MKIRNWFGLVFDLVLAVAILTLIGLALRHAPPVVQRLPHW